MTIFEKILNKEVPADVVYEDDKVIAFKDIAPQATHHILFIHKKKKTMDVNDMMETSPEQVMDIFHAINKYTTDNNINDNGFRVVTNMGKDGCQSVFYTHFHLLAGEQLGSFGR